jgi:hypothetical protein
MITQEQFQTLLPLACSWAEEQERVILATGSPLTFSRMVDAQRAGVVRPEKVRLLEVGAIPIPQHPLLRFAVQETQLITPQTAGMTLRYGIFVRSDYWSDRRLLMHEFVHTAQYERLGGIQQFLQRYLYECITIGYPAAPMEQEAVTTAAGLCAP